jgi:hypothetical protein
MQRNNQHPTPNTTQHHPTPPNITQHHPTPPNTIQHHPTPPQRVTYPVALDAKADDRDNLGLISMMQYSLEKGFSAYWMLHSPTMPMCRTVLMAVSRNMWYSSLLKVWELIKYF